MKLKPFLICKIVLILIVLSGIFFATFGQKFLNLNESFQSDLEHQEGSEYQGGYHRALPGQDCSKKCRWDCKMPEVEQEEKAICRPAQCEVLCSEIESAKCTVTAPTPKCRNVCYKSEGKCNSGKCPRCYSVCDEVKASVSCCKPKAVCKTVCKKPDCKFQYSRPSKVQKPICKLRCDKDENLLNKVGF